MMVHGRRGSYHLGLGGSLIFVNPHVRVEACGFKGLGSKGGLESPDAPRAFSMIGILAPWLFTKSP